MSLGLNSLKYLKINVVFADFGGTCTERFELRFISPTYQRKEVGNRHRRMSTPEFAYVLYIFVLTEHDFGFPIIRDALKLSI